MSTLCSKSKRIRLLNLNVLVCKGPSYLCNQILFHNTYLSIIYTYFSIKEILKTFNITTKLWNTTNSILHKHNKQVLKRIITMQLPNIFKGFDYIMKEFATANDHNRIGGLVKKIFCEYKYLIKQRIKDKYDILLQLWTRTGSNFSIHHYRYQYFGTDSICVLNNIWSLGNCDFTINFIKYFMKDNNLTYTNISFNGENDTYLRYITNGNKLELLPNFYMNSFWHGWNLEERYKSIIFNVNLFIERNDKLRIGFICNSIKYCFIAGGYYEAAIHYIDKLAIDLKHLHKTKGLKLSVRNSDIRTLALKCYVDPALHYKYCIKGNRENNPWYQYKAIGKHKNSKYRRIVKYTFKNIENIIDHESFKAWNHLFFFLTEALKWDEEKLVQGIANESFYKNDTEDNKDMWGFIIHMFIEKGWEWKNTEENEEE